MSAASRACLHDMFRHCSCCCFCLWSWVRKHSRRRSCAYHYLTKHSLQEYLPISSIPAKHVTSCSPPHSEHRSTQTQHLFGTALHSNHDSLEWNASNVTVAKLWSEQKCMYGAWPPLPVSRGRWWGWTWRRPLATHLQAPLHVMFCHHTSRVHILFYLLSTPQQ